MPDSTLFYGLVINCIHFILERMVAEKEREPEEGEAEKSPSKIVDENLS
jgi:hypothetical protein